MCNSFYGFQLKNSAWRVRIFHSFQSLREQLTVWAAHISWLPKADYLNPFWTPWHIDCLMASRIWHAGCNSLPMCKCLGLYDMPSGCPRHLCRTGRYDTRPKGDPCSSIMPDEGQTKSLKAIERALDAYVWASVSTTPDKELGDEHLSVLIETLSG